MDKFEEYHKTYDELSIKHGVSTSAIVNQFRNKIKTSENAFKYHYEKFCVAIESNPRWKKSKSLKF